MKRWQQVTGALVVLALAGILAIVFFAKTDTASDIPDVRGNMPTGDSYGNPKWVKPLLDAGYCVRFHYDGNQRTIDMGDGKVAVISDSYYIVDERLDPPSPSTGPTVTVTVTGTPMGGPTVNWDAMPMRCPSVHA